MRWPPHIHSTDARFQHPTRASLLQNEKVVNLSQTLYVKASLERIGEEKVKNKSRDEQKKGSACRLPTSLSICRVLSRVRRIVEASCLFDGRVESRVGALCRGESRIVLRSAEVSRVGGFCGGEKSSWRCSIVSPNLFQHPALTRPIEP
jgi:hypothetical protein